MIFPHASPDYFAEFAAHARELGAKIIGGCCGTTPVEIAAIRTAVEDERKPRTPLVFEERELAAALGEEQRETGLGKALREGEWIVSVQLDPPLGGNISGARRAHPGAEGLRARRLRRRQRQRGRPRRDALDHGLVRPRARRRHRDDPAPDDARLHRDGPRGHAFGAHAEGVRNVLAVTGDPPEVGDYPGSRGVYEVDAIGLVELMARLNKGEDFNGRPIDAPTSFLIGVAVNPTADDLDVELDRYRRKIEAGAQFAMTQLVFDLDHLDSFLERLGGPSPIPVLVGICPIWSYRFALRLHNELPGIVVPESLQEALRDAGPDAPEVGMAYAKELYAAAREKAAGVYLVAPYRRPLNVLELIG